MPEDMSFWREFGARYTGNFNSHDVQGMYDFYTEDAVMVREPGVAVTKSEEAKAEIQGWFKAYFDAYDPKLTIDIRHVYESGGVALLIVDHTIAHTVDGVTTLHEGTSTDVAVKGADGVWRYAIDNPNGVSRPQ